MLHVVMSTPKVVLKKKGDDSLFSRYWLLNRSRIFVLFVAGFSSVFSFSPTYATIFSRFAGDFIHLSKQHHRINFRGFSNISCDKLNEAAIAIAQKVGCPAIQGKQATREDAGLEENDFVHVDIGGTYFHQYKNGLETGFRHSLNINETYFAPYPSEEYPIPHLVKINQGAWPSDGPFGQVKNPFPISTNFASYLTIQNGPLTNGNINEFVRCLKPGGLAGLWIGDDQAQEIEELRTELNGVRLISTDEFSGNAGAEKVIMLKNPGVFSFQSNHGARSYLTVNNPVSDGSYDWAFFGTESYTSGQSRYSNLLNLVAERSGDTCRIAANHGARSYLAVNNPVSDGSYDWAFFGTESYLNGQSRYSNLFKLALFYEQSGDPYYAVQSDHGARSYLAINTIGDGSYNWAIFGTESYINSNDYYKLLKIYVH